MVNQKRLIRVSSCSECPYNGKCPAFKKLTKKQIVFINLSDSVPANFMLKDCHLEEEA